jgi:hypothetical protein
MTSSVTSIVSVRSDATPFPALLYGVLICGIGFIVYFAGVMAGFLRLFLDPHGYLVPWISRIVWYSGVPIVIGVLLVFTDLFLLLPRKRVGKEVTWTPLKTSSVTVVLTAYNDELSIGESVLDFRRHPKVKRVVVVDNNSKDRTSEVAREAGAIVVVEQRPGYGNCVWRALYEGAQYTDTEFTLLCEGDMTFRAYDIEKFLAYAPHAGIVNGTRIVEQLRQYQTQLTTFMYYGNFFGGKLLEAKHIGRGTFTDLGTTYKLCRNSTLQYILPRLNRDINLEFNAYFLDTALACGIAIVECPVTFHNRMGVSKGGNVSNARAIKVGLRMFRGLLFGWEGLACKR